MARNQYGPDQSFGRAQVFQQERYRSPAWGYHIAKKEALKKKMSADQAEYEEMEDLKAWEDDRNFQEITGQMRDLENIWNQSFQAGYNIANPTTEKEQILAKKFAEKKGRVKQASDLYARQGAAVQAAWDAMQEEDTDKVKTRQKIMDYIDYEGDIFERAKQVPNLVVHKSEPMDILKIITDDIIDYTSVSKQVLSDSIDPASGKIKKVTKEGRLKKDRADSLEKTWYAQKAIGPEFMEGIANFMRGDIKNNLDPNKEEDVFKYYKNEFINVKSGSKVEETFYATGDGIKISIGSGIPERDERGMFKANADTVLIHSEDESRPSEHTSPFAVNLQGSFKATPGDAIAVDVTENLINTQDGLPEERGGNYSVLPSKIIFLPVADGNNDLNSMGSMWGPLQNIFKPMNTFKNKPIPDAQFAEVGKINDKLTGSGKRIGYRWVAYFMVRTKYGLVEKGDDISSFNRSDYVPYEEIKDDVKAKAGGMEKVDWSQYEQAVEEILKNLNAGILDTTKKNEYDF